MFEHQAMRRRHWLKAAASVAALPGLAAIGLARAQQVEEPLSQSVQTALSAAISEAPPPRPHFDDMDERLDYLHWLGTMSERLRPRMANWDRRIEFLETVWYESRRAGLETALVLGLIQTESAFRQYAISVAGAIGYMQVMPFWTRLIGDGDIAKLFYMPTNLRYGCVILRHYLDIEKGDVFMALGRYNGSRGRDPYPNSVFGHRQNWLCPPRPLAPVPTIIGK